MVKLYVNLQYILPYSSLVGDFVKMGLILETFMGYKNQSNTCYPLAIMKMIRNRLLLFLLIDKRRNLSLQSHDFVYYR